MKQEIFINSTPQESRIAIIEDGHACRVLHRTQRRDGRRGQYLQRQGRAGFTRHAGGFRRDRHGQGGISPRFGFLRASDDVQFISSSNDDVEFEEAPPKPIPSRRLPLEKQLSRGEEVLVQVAKDPLGTKGARVTSHISLPGPLHGLHAREQAYRHFAAH